MCGAAGRRALVARDRNRETSDARFVYDRCTACTTVFLTNAPPDLVSYYRGSYYGFRPDGEPDWRGDDFRESIERERVQLLLRNVHPGRLIEIGAGSGGFAAAASGAGFEVSAIEMDDGCCRYMSDRLGIRTICSDDPVRALQGLPEASVIAMWHVLEHLPNPAQVLAAAADRLEPEGILALGVPNPASIQFRLLGSRWAHLDAPRHLVLAPAPTLIERAAAMGLRCLFATTDDPFGHHCNIHGWTYALHRRPGVGPAPAHSHAGLALARLARPIERRDLLGSALLLLLRRDAEAET
jgi:SAM-dependent methyltransferase